MMITDINTQVRIADMVWDYDALIENNLARIAKLEQTAQLLYRKYFQNPDESWEERPLDDILIVHRGKSYKGSELSENDGVDLVNLKCFNRGGGFRKDGLKKFVGGYKESQVVRRGDIVLCNTDMTQERMIVARSALVPTLPTGIGVVSHHVYRIEVRNNTNTLWLYSFLRWSNFPDIVKNHANGANVLGLARERITDFQTKIPPKELQDDFAQKVRPIFHLIDTLEQKNEKLKEARDLLLTRLMSGEIVL
jgi:type I restriction enzyme S subunit